jgi:hypothetical protein
VQIILVTGLDEPHFEENSSFVRAAGLICRENLAALRMRLIKEMCDLDETPPGSKSRLPDAT